MNKNCTSKRFEKLTKIGKLLKVLLIINFIIFGFV